MKQILFLISISVSNLIYCQQSFIDNSFGKNGFVAGVLPGVVNSIVQQPDGKLLAAGSFEEKYSIARFLNDGTLDSSFGKDGFTIGNPAGGAYDLLLTADKKLLISGSYLDENFIEEYFVSRFTINGKIDSSFGVNGTRVIPKAHRADVYTQIALNNDGSIIAGGFGTNSVITLDSQYTILSRLSADGIFDNTFGDKGYVLNLAFLNMKDLAIQPDGKIVTAGYDFGFNFSFSRYNSDGSLDKSFGKDGNEIFIMGGYNEPHKIIVQPSGKLMIGGLNFSNMCALRLNTNGSLDETFGDSGKVLIEFEDSVSYAYDMIQQPDGKFILAGGATDLKQTGSSFALCRITNNGKIDSSFGVNGLQTTVYTNESGANCAVLQNDNKVVLAGYYQGKKDQPSYILVRYNNEINKKQLITTKIRNWLQHHNGLTWDANSNISSYAVQRSYDGVHFNSIARIYAGNTSNYTYQDPMPLSGNNYYRVQTTSADGSVNYSNVIAATANEDAIKISPNPAKNVLRIEGLSSLNKAKLTVVDFSGNEKMQAVANNTSYNLNIASLKPGNYLLKIEMDGEVLSKKFVKE